PDGVLAVNIDGFTLRQEQVAMAQVVGQSLAQQQLCVIEAGTGIGKTFAYLVPALFAGKRIVVSTGTKTLQDQLFRRDLPLIAGALGRPAKVAILKGRANYLCLHRLEMAERANALEAGLSRTRHRQQTQLLERIRRFAMTTQRGDISELPTVSDADPIWQSVTSTRENCLGVDCPVFQRCHVVAARREAQAADVVVVNHHLLMADMMLKEQGFGDLLPGADAIVVDEAHQLPEVAEQFLGFSVSTRQIQNLCRDVLVELQTQRIDAEALVGAVNGLERSVADGADTLQAERCEFAQWPSAFVESFGAVAGGVQSVVDQLAALASNEPVFAALCERTAEIGRRMNALQETSDDASVAKGVRWAQSTRQGFSVHFAPIDIATQLQAMIQKHGATWIFTSATLSIAGDFAHYLQRVGIEDARTHCYGSPFDYENQALMYLPRQLDDPSSPHHTRQVVEAALPVLEASGGRAFLLFTSHRALRAAATYLQERWGNEAPYPLLVQGDIPKDLLLQRFRELGNAVLLGTGSFWEGVDVKGTALAVVVIDKLPFAVPDDPVMKARLAAIEQRGGNPFFEEQIPQAVLALKQGVGRLIRDSADFGVVMLCDRRLTSRSYGRVFLNSLPPMPRTEKLADVTAFLHRHLSAVGLSPQTSALRAIGES
ncbi:MAG TPA: ATP-dependent DNA helicase, partial [Steroidobacteraceae bacterium]|nr:ATP-dependent DNA helicase [Steroidobacteraceae bacterium]